MAVRQQSKHELVAALEGRYRLVRPQFLANVCSNGQDRPVVIEPEKTHKARENRREEQQSCAPLGAVFGERNADDDAEYREREREELELLAAAAINLGSEPAVLCTPELVFF